MARVTGFRCVDERGDPVLCDAYGNNVALRCKGCGHPMLAIIIPEQNKRGSTPDNPAKCRHCGYCCWISADLERQTLTVNWLDEQLGGHP